MAYLGELEGLPSQVGQAGKFITTNGTNASWTSPKEVIAVGDLLDATIASPASGQALIWDGTAWVNGNKQDTLGFTPIQQGGGIGQSTNKVYIGWSDSNLKLKCTVDVVDLGSIWTDFSTATYLASNGYQMLSNGFIIQWGQVPGGSLSCKSVTFPMAFPNICASVVATHHTGTSCRESGTANNDTINSVSSTGFNVRTDTAVSTAQWIAIGY